MSKHEELTQIYTTFNGKLLAHADLLSNIQQGKFMPVTIQLAPVEACDSMCPWCSVSNRPLKSAMKWPQVEAVLYAFKTLGAKALEITGGGNPLLYKDKEANKDINDIIRLAEDLGYKIGIITNSVKLKTLDKDLYKYIQWLRVSLIELDAKTKPEDYDFNEFPENRMGVSYIINEGTHQNHLDKVGRYEITSVDTIRKIKQLIDLHPEIRFCRIVGNCLDKGSHLRTNSYWREVIDEVANDSRTFVKDVGDNEYPYPNFCGVGMIRPYIAPSPDGDGKYYAYMCTSHVLNKRTYDLDYAMCEITNASGIINAWSRMNRSFKDNGYPYEVHGNKGKNWDAPPGCKSCYYYNNNVLLETVINARKNGDWEFV